MQIGLIIYGSLDTMSGGYLYDRKLVEYLRSQGDRVEIISLPWRNYAAHLTDNLWFRLWSPGARSWNIRQQAARLQNLDLLIQDELNHPSLLLANQGQHPYPIISLVHHLRCSELRPGWQNALYRVVEKRYLESVDGFIFNSETTRNVVHEIMNQRKPSIVAYPPTDQFGEPIAEQEIVSRAETTPLRILFLGNVIERKGLDTLLKAVSTQPSAFQVEVIGSLAADTQYVKRIREFISVHHLSSFVSLHGSLENEEVTKKLKQAHVLVVPSSYEGYGIVYLEGMSFGLPAIGTTAGAASEIITEGVDGFLVEQDNADLLARRLRVLNEKREILIRMSLAARERYLRQPKWVETADQIREFLLKQIQGFSV